MKHYTSPWYRGDPDDILVYGCGETEEEAKVDHDNNLRALLQCARVRNLKFNKKKLRLRVSEIPYMGQVLCKDGLSPDPMKIKAIMEMTKPDNKKAVGLQRLLSSVNYLSRFLPKLAEAAEPLQRLIVKDVPFHWESQQEQSFKNLKQLRCSAPVLKFYDMNNAVTIQFDASESRLGATLLQNGKPVAFASRALNRGEQNYVQIEKECLAVVLACERFNQYIYGRDYINVQSDHKPLVPIFRKSIFKVPKRLQRMLIRLRKFNLELGVFTSCHVESCISWRYSYKKYQWLSDIRTFKEIENINQVEYVCISNATQIDIQKATKMDKSIQDVMSVVKKG